MSNVINYRNGYVNVSMQNIFESLKSIKVPKTVKLYIVMKTPGGNVYIPAYSPFQVPSKPHRYNGPEQSETRQFEQKSD